MLNKKQKNQLPKIAISQLAEEAEEASAKHKILTAREIFGRHLKHMDKYRDYFFKEPWPKKWSYTWATTFTPDDIEFMNADDDDYAERVLTVILKKNISLQGYNSLGTAHTMMAYHNKIVKPELKKVYEAFKELVATGLSAEEILKKLMENDDASFIHDSLLEPFEENYFTEALELKIGEVLELIHKKGEPECEDARETCEYRRERARLIRDKK